MGNILLIDPPWYALQNMMAWKVSYGLASIAAILKENKHTCVIYDGEFGMLKSSGDKESIITNFDLYRSNLEDNSFIWQETAKRIKRIIINLNANIVGITIPTPKYSIAIKIANYLKSQFPFITIAAGGPHPTILPLETVKEPSIDIAVKGEGEYTFLEVVNAIDNGGGLSDIPGIAFKLNSNVCDNPPRGYIKDLDGLPFPAWDLTYGFGDYNPNYFGTLFTSRGCPYRCNFCASHIIWGRKVRYVSADRVLAELQYAYEKYKTTEFRFNDDTFIVDRERVIKICEGIIRSKMNIKWSCEIRADLCSYEVLKVMKAAGCSKVYMGIEAGNAEILKYIRKDITLDQVYKAVAAAKKAKLSITGNFMIGFPPESIKEVKDSIKLMDRLKMDSTCWSIATPHPGTKLYEEAMQDGLIPSQPNWSYSFHHSPSLCLSKKIDSQSFIDIITGIQEKMDKADKSRRRREKAEYLIRLAIIHPNIFIEKMYKRLWGSL